MALTAGPRAASLRGAWLPLAVLAVIVASLVAVVALSQTVGGSDAPPEPPAFAGVPPSPLTVMDVKQRDGDVLTLVRDGVETAFTVPPEALIERLQPIDAGDIREGDTLTVIGIPNEVLSFSIHFIVVVDGPTQTVDGVARSAGGFAGHEASGDRADRPVIGGVVESARGDEVVVAGPDGPVTVELNEAEPARLFRVQEVEVEAIQDGDRVAANFAAPTIGAILVMPPESR
jgi:hypothetical protein